MTLTGRLARAGVACALGLLVLTGAGGTGASWVDRVEREPGTVTAGGVSVTPGAQRVELHSRQPAGSRTYAASTTCTPATGYTECRVITTTVTQEALIPGDRVVVVDRASVTARGTNLTGTLDVRVRPLTSSALSAFSGTATATTTITPPTGSPVTGETGSFPVSRSTGAGLGDYSVRTVITTPPSGPTGEWGTALTGQRLYDGAYTYTFTQS